MPLNRTLMTLCLGAVTCAAQAQVTVLTNTSVITMEREGDVLADHAVVVRDGRIEWLGPSPDAPAPDGATVIDCADAYLMPGLADMHVHIWHPSDLKLFTAWGVTSIRNMWGTPLQQTMARRIERGATLGPTLYTTGAIIDGVPPIWPQSIGVENEEQARSAVRAQHDLGFGFIKVYSMLSPEAFHGACDEAKTLGMRITGHVPVSVPLTEAFGAGQECVEHLTGYLRASQSADSPINELTLEDNRRILQGEIRREMLANFDTEAMHRAVELTERHGVWNVPTLIVVQRGYASPAERRALLDNERMAYVSRFTRRMWPPRPADDDERGAEIQEDIDRLMHARRSIVLALHEAGCGLLVGTDMPNPFVWTGYSVHEELRALVGCGLSEYEALRCATTNAARYLDAWTEFGRVAPGLRADLLLLDANPLEDIRATQQIRGVMSRGRWMDRQAIDAALESVAQEFAGDH